MGIEGLAPDPLLLLGAVALDAFLGDPVYRLHPVRLAGGALSRIEAVLRRLGLDGHGGGCLLFAVLGALCVGLVAGAAWGLGRLSPALAQLFHLFLLYSLLALRDLLKHGMAIDRAAAGGDLAGARQAAARLVARDTAPMDAAACRRAGMESLAENAVDGFVSPIFWYALLGLPGVVLFKVVSTMDSMVGNRSPRYLRFGWCGARLDDLLNYLPARLTWGLMVLAALVLPGCSARKALSVGWRQHGLVPGPNAGWSEAAAAGALQCRLAGPIWQGGERITDLWLGRPGDPEGGAPETCAAPASSSRRPAWPLPGLWRRFSGEGRLGMESPRLSGSESAWETPSLHASVQGSITSIPVPEKSRTFRVATAMARDRAIAAI